MVIVGITGAIGHGKSSLADAMVRNQPKSLHIEAYRLVAEVADAWHTELKEPPQAGDYRALNAWIKTLPAIIKKVVRVNTTFSQLRVRPQDIAADPLAYQKLFQHLDALKLNPKLSKDKISDTNKAAYRLVLQWLGGYLVAKVSPTIWWDEIIRRAQKASKNGSQLAVLGGVRYPGDAKVVRQAVVVKLFKSSGLICRKWTSWIQPNGSVKTSNRM